LMEVVHVLQFPHVPNLNMSLSD